MTTAPPAHPAAWPCRHHALPLAPRTLVMEFMIETTQSILDVDGNDTYTAGNFSQGLGYWYGTGLLWDGGGDDTFTSVYFTQGSGAHFAVGALIDEGGNDVHHLEPNAGAAFGFGWDVVNAFLLDRGAKVIARARQALETQQDHYAELGQLANRLAEAAYLLGGRTDEVVGLDAFIGTSSAASAGSPLRIFGHRAPAAEGQTQAVQILVMMERIAPGPVHEPDIGIDEPAAVVVVRRARIEQHVGNARDWNGAFRRIGRRRDFRTRNVDTRHADPAHRAMAEAEAAARKPDAAEHRRKRDRHPERLLAAMRALQRPCAGDEAPHAGGAAGEIADRFRLDTADAGGPFRGLGHAVIAAEEIALEPLEAGAVARQKPLGEHRNIDPALPQRLQSVARASPRNDSCPSVAGRRRSARCDSVWLPDRLSRWTLP